MSHSSLYLLGLSDSERLAAEQAVGLLALPPASKRIDSLEGTNEPGRTAGSAILVLAGDGLAALPEALSALDLGGLPRFAVVALGGETSDGRVITVPRALWNDVTAALLIPAARQLHRFARENMARRGDLGSVGRRISHDLRAPLSAIVSATEVIRDGLETSASESLPFTRTITEAVSEQEKILRRVGVLLKASAQPETVEEVPMIEPLHAAIQRNEVRAAELDVVLAIEADWPVVRGVSCWLEAIWSELIQNAIEYSGRPKPTLAIGHSAIEGGHRFWVESPGKEITAEKKRFLFFPFEQLHRLDAPRGLGLPIVRRFVELHGGEFGYDALPEGARFWFTVPARA